MANSIEWERKSVGKTTRKKQESSANQALILSRTIVKPFFTSLHYSPHRERIEIGCIEFGGLSQMTQFFFTTYFGYTIFVQGSNNTWVLTAQWMLCGGPEDQK